MRVMPVLAALDADQDGKISKSEIENATAALKKLDKNNDGDLTPDEMRPDFSAMRGRFGGDRPDGPPRRGRPPLEGDQEQDRDGDDEASNRRGGPRGGAADMVARILENDSDGDGKVSKQEAPERMQDFFARVDQDGDGFVTREEIEQVAERMARGRGRQSDRPAGAEAMARMFDNRDADGDGKLSGDEIPEAMAGRLERIDRDGDGSISKDELQAASRMRRGGDRQGDDEPGGRQPRRPE